MPKHEPRPDAGRDATDKGRSLDLDLADVETWPQMMTPDEVAAVMRVNYRTVLKQIKDGRIAAHRIGVGYRVNKSWLLDHIGQRPQPCDDD